MTTMMEVALASLAFAVAALAAATMGYAIQRGGTCTVAAVSEVLAQRRFDRIAAMAEASLWVAGGLALARSLHLLASAPVGYAVTLGTFAGGALLGLGAWVNKACVFGAIARFGSGEWAYAATPLGFYAGCLAVGTFVAPPAARPLQGESPVLEFAPAATLAFLAYALWRLARPLAAIAGEGLGRAIARRVWAPHAATIVIGLAFLVMLPLVGRWAYTDLLADLSRGMASSLAARDLLLAALLGGAVWGGYGAGRFAPARVSMGGVARCFAGGALMGAGSLLIPGSNDGLILIGMPMLWTYAWLAFGTMCLTIAAALLIERAWAQAAQGVAHPS
jgi:toxin CptA